MPKRIHIKIADRGWILEKCAREIAERASNITYGTDPDASADLQYYINYSARSRRVSATEVAFFTHSERDPNARQRYFDAARDVDRCVCMSARYAQELIESGIPLEKVTTIAPGVDLDEFRPKVRIGVVGRTYHTGRKGEALIAEVMDVPGIEWRFTGSGWPGPSTHVPDGRMADFYNDLDYVLVPALYEGGPMSVLEGLACGVPIIASDVGWVPDYPHIPFENGNGQSLREVLTRLVAEREALREAVRDRSWDNWADAHLELFDRLLGGATSDEAGHPDQTPESVSATLVIHSESKSLGGPSVRVPRTASELARIGVAASLPQEHPDNFDDSELAHVFNVWPADSCFRVLDRARAVGRRTILSPIFLNLANLRIASTTLPQLFSGDRPASDIDDALSEIARQIDCERNLPIREPFEGFHERVRVCVDIADEVIFLSEYERRCVEYIGANPRSSTLVRNPVDEAAFADADPSLFAERFGLQDYILCVGRIEPRKNQLVLAHAARSLGIPAVFIGHTENQPYLDLVRKAAGPAAHFIPRISPGDPLLKSAFAGATVFCLPSWAEGAPLAALEAAAAGSPLVLSDRSSEQEYFGEFAHYVNPADVHAMRSALESAASERGDERRRAELRKHVEANFSWEKYARGTKEAYEAVHSSRPVAVPGSPADERIYFDLTTSCHGSGNPTGIARVESLALKALLAEFGDRVIPIAWNSRTKNYVQLSRAAALMGIGIPELERLESSGDVQLVSRLGVTGGRILVLGGAWIRNPEYIGALHALKLEMRANLSVLVHDLIQMRLSHMYPDGVGKVFADNARQLVRIADDFLVYSESTRADLREFLADNAAFFKKISRFRLGDINALHHHGEQPTGEESPLQQRFSGAKFALYVSSIEIRKNHALLLNVWRRLIEERGSATPHLLFVGRPLWRGTEIVELIDRDERLRPFVHLLQDVDDRDLDWFYRNCEFTLYPSLYEGWGLPVAESLSYGKMCIASDSTSTREVAPGLTDLIDPYDFRAWRDRIAFYLDNPAALKAAEECIRSKHTEYPWTDSVREIVSALDSLQPAAVESAFLFPGETIEFDASAGTGTAICAGGWGNPERTGRWSVGASSKLAFRYRAKGDQFHLRLRLYALTRPNHATRSFRVRINGQSDELIEIGGRPSLLDFAVPVRRAEGAAYSDNEIIFEPLELISPSAITGSSDARLLGIHLMAVQVANDAEDLTLSAAPPPAAAGSSARGQKPAEQLVAAKELVVLPRRFTGKRPIARFARAVGFDRIWLRMHARKFRRTYASIALIVDYLQQEKRA